jgi:hypothetical protein
VDQIVAADSSLYMVGANGWVPAVWQYSGWGTNWTNLTGTPLQNALSTWALGTSHPAAATAYSPASGTLLPTTANGDASYLDVQQGNLADCWQLASLAEVAARVPIYIDGMFIYDGTAVENGSQVGVYSVRFFNSSGVAHYVTVDTELPSGGYDYDHLVGGAGAVNGSSTPVLWAALAEKAYAEANALGYVTTNNVGTNSYAAMNYGDPVWALQAITGKPASDYNFNSSDVASAWNAGQFVVLCTPNQPASSYIVGNHCYAMVGYDPSRAWSYEIYNPWGTDSNGWAPGYSGTTYGLFWASGSFLSQNFDTEAFGLGAACLGAAPSGHDAALPGSAAEYQSLSQTAFTSGVGPTGTRQANQGLAERTTTQTAGTGADQAVADLASRLATHKRMDVVDALFADAASW